MAEESQAQEERIAEKGVMIKMEEEKRKVATTATIRAAPITHLIVIVPIAARGTRDDARDHWVF